VSGFAYAERDPVYIVSQMDLECRFQWVKTHPAGRRCQHDGCDTILSIYNPNDCCDLHAERPNPNGVMHYLGRAFAVCRECGEIIEVKGGRNPGICMSCRRKAVVTEKRCPRCGKVKSLSCFGVDRRSPSGRASYCAACERQRQRDKRQRRIARSNNDIERPA
jgi:hypothetical protein